VNSQENVNKDIIRSLVNTNENSVIILLLQP